MNDRRHLVRPMFASVLIVASLWLAFAAVAAEEFGVGIALTKHPGGFRVMKVVPNSPAALSNSIKEGDLIIAVAQADKEPVSLEGLEFVGQAVAMIRGPKGSVVRLTVVSGATNIAQTKVVSLVRGELQGLPLGGLGLKVLADGAPAPDVEWLNLPDKRAGKPGDHRSKIVILEFWATWCAPCLKLMPEFQKHAERLSARKDVVCITVSLDEKPETAAKRLQAQGWIKTLNVWANTSVAEAFGVGSLPRLYIVNPQGRIAYQGYPLDEEALVRLLQKLDAAK